MNPAITLDEIWRRIDWIKTRPHEKPGGGHRDAAKAEHYKETGEKMITTEEFEENSEPYVYVSAREQSRILLDGLVKHFEDHPAIAATLDHVMFADWQMREDAKVLTLVAGDPLLSDRLVNYGERIATAFSEQTKRADPERSDDDRLPVKVVVRICNLGCPLATRSESTEKDPSPDSPGTPAAPPGGGNLGARRTFTACGFSRDCPCSLCRQDRT